VSKIHAQSLHHPKDEAPMLQARTLPPVRFPNLSAPSDLQRVAAASNDHLQTFAASSRQPDQQSSRSVGIQKLLNPVECKGRSNASIAPGSVNAGLPILPRSDAHSLSLARSSPYRPVIQDALRAQNCRRTRGVKPEPPQPASQADSQYSSYSRISQTESVIAPPMVSTCQPRYLSSDPLSGPTSTMPQISPAPEAFEMPPSTAAAQSQNQRMALETAQGIIQVPVDLQTASKVHDNKRKRNATASHLFRQRQKEKDRETSGKIARLEAQLSKVTEERDYYQKERDYF
ncbi:MAG: hypothetical protein Q9179_007989, partial [Wetmoreana sp. 5 TL-2023]